MLIIFTVLYLVGVFLTGYDKYCTVLDVLEKPGLYRTPPLHMGFTILRLVLSYGSLVGIYFTWGIYPAIAAWVVRFVFSTYVLRHYYDRQVAQWIPHFVKTLEEETKGAEKQSTDKEIMAEAVRLSQRMVNKAMRGEAI